MTNFSNRVNLLLSVEKYDTTEDWRTWEERICDSIRALGAEETAGRISTCDENEEMILSTTKYIQLKVRPYDYVGECIETVNELNKIVESRVHTKTF